MIVTTLNEHALSLEQGALVSVDEVSSRIRILPIST